MLAVDVDLESQVLKEKIVVTVSVEIPYCTGGIRRDIVSVQSIVYSAGVKLSLISVPIITMMSMSLTTNRRRSMIGIIRILIV